MGADRSWATETMAISVPTSTIQAESYNRSGTSSGNHGDHVAGTILGGGIYDPDGMGLAPGADLVYSSYPANFTSVDQDYVNYNVRITTSSYSNGCNAGYTSTTQQVDNDILQNPKLMHVFSAGNSATSDCGYGAGSGWEHHRWTQGRKECHRLGEHDLLRM